MKPQPSPQSDGWLMQLQAISLERLKDSEAETLVIDPTRGGDGDAAGFWKKSEIDQLKRGDRLVLAYLSVGEAESYRDYWKPSWNTRPPKFLAAANPDYPDNYLVRYWDPEWQALLDSRLAQIAEAGFDGVYLDKVDAFEDWEGRENHFDIEKLKKQMAELVAGVRKSGDKLWEKRDEQFSLFLQNGWELWDRPELGPIVDGVGVEEFSLGWEGEDGQKTPEGVRRRIREQLEANKKNGWKVLILDYPGADSSSQEKKLARQEAQEIGALFYLAPRKLDALEYE